jgi:hypothetical protein
LKCGALELWAVRSHKTTMIIGDVHVGPSHTSGNFTLAIPFAACSANWLYDGEALKAKRFDIGCLVLFRFKHCSADSPKLFRLTKSGKDEFSEGHSRSRNVNFMPRRNGIFPILRNFQLVLLTIPEGITKNLDPALECSSRRVYGKVEMDLRAIWLLSSWDQTVKVFKFRLCEIKFHWFRFLISRGWFYLFSHTFGFFTSPGFYRCLPYRQIHHIILPLTYHRCLQWLVASLAIVVQR